MEQRKIAGMLYNRIINIPFPSVDPNGDEEYIENLSNQYLYRILIIKKCTSETVVVHVMGEQTFCFALIKKLQSKNIKCVASTTQRIAEEKDGVKTSIFKFCSFREYK